MQTAPITIHSPYAALRKAAKLARVPKRDIGDFIGDTVVRAIQAGKGGAAFGAFLSSRAIGWRAHGESRSGASIISRRSITELVNGEDSVSAIGSLPWLVDPERVLIALEGLSMVDRLPSKQRAAIFASMTGQDCMPGVTPANFRKLVSLARKALRDLDA